ncbi:DNA-protecting protein DprA [Bacillus lacus]|uniref:DNA-protecting protein DprA n=1 Tax=Metabacillus lacus TaxID=1983721 RepID=A0A7X2LWU0_9BACI|nr:DNA-processing protein DprA [Metabacillus lacus]MRX70581.1 DNA-protecting protein DprA [Metabacillus lacus]
MEETRLNLIKMCASGKVSSKTISQLFIKNPTLSLLQDSGPASPLDNSRLSHLLKEISQHPADNLLQQCKQQNIELITILDDKYPPLLKEIYDPPALLYCKGNTDLLGIRSLSVVGTRTPSSYGKNMISSLLSPLLKDGWVMISGLAEGIDALAHQEAIRQSGKTIGVIAGGHRHIYPSSNKELAAIMAKEHLILSEYPPDTRPKKWQFPLRNRIISGLSMGTLVVEAKEKSGSLITASAALNEGREVFAVPGNILQDTAKGTNRLIQQGAKLVMTAEDITEELSYLYA